MAQLPTPEKAARAVLEICAALQLRPGHALPLRALHQRAIKQGLTGDELVDGIEKGVEFGWFEASDGDAQFLTDAGFTEM